MSTTFAIPVAISLIAFLVADEGASLLIGAKKRIFTLSDRSGAQPRLSELGKSKAEDFENFRIFQLAITAFFAAPILLLFLLGTLSLQLWIALTTVAIGASLLLTERNLTARVKRKRNQIESEFPALIETLTLAIGAGESPSSAIRRISQRAHGYLADEFREMIVEVERGAPFHIALDSLGRRVNSRALRRFVDSLNITISRGSPLVETLAHNAEEIRNSEKVKLLRAAGKAEISMMIPVVFLILPISILFALFPSLHSLQLFT